MGVRDPARRAARRKMRCPATEWYIFCTFWNRAARGDGRTGYPNFDASHRAKRRGEEFVKPKILCHERVQQQVDRPFAVGFRHFERKGFAFQHVGEPRHRLFEFVEPGRRLFVVGPQHHRPPILRLGPQRIEKQQPRGSQPVHEKVIPPPQASSAAILFRTGARPAPLRFAFCSPAGGLLDFAFGPDGTALLGPMVWPSRAGEPEHWEQRLPFAAAITPDCRPSASENGDLLGE